MKYLPHFLSGALLFAGSTMVYAQTQPLPQGDRPINNERAQSGQSERQKGQENQPGEQNDKGGNPVGEGTGKQGRDQGNSGGTGSSSQEDQRAQQNGDGSNGQSQKRHAGKKLEAKQRTVVRESLGKRHMRPARVNFSINVGAVVPRTVELYDLPATLIEYEPSYSRYKFVMSDDNTILVIDPETWTIIDVIEI